MPVGAVPPPYGPPPGAPGGQPPFGAVPPSAPPGTPPPGWAAPPPGGWVAPPQGQFAAPPPAGNANGIATASLVVGIVSLVFCFAFIGGVVAVVLGIVGMGRAKERGGAKRGQAIAGIILGILSVLVGVGTWVGIARGVNSAVDSIDQITGPAAADTFDVRVDDCKIDRTGSATATGTIDNTSSKERNFEIEVSFVRDGKVLDSGSTVVFSIPAGDGDTWEVDGRVSGSGGISCRVTSVNNYLN